MSEMDPELQDVLGDPELIRIARLLSSARSPEPPLDDAFKSGLRRQLMDRAWDRAEGRTAWWRRLLAPQGMAWAGAAALVVIVASVVVYTATLPPGAITEEVKASSPLQGNPSVAPKQAIQVAFNQPMDQPSTEAAVTITPATTVLYSWNGNSTLMSVQPTAGNLAPNTQYQVTIGPGAKTLSGATSRTAQTFTFVTTTEPSPAPTPTPVVTPSGNPTLLAGVVRLTADYPPTGTVYPVVWSSDSTTLYFVGPGGALESIAVAGGNPKTLVPDGVSLPALAPAGDRLAYVRAGNIEILGLTTGATTEVSLPTPPTALRWVKDRLYWGSGGSLFRLEAAGPLKLADASDLSGALVSIAPDGKNAVVQVADGLFLLDATSGKTAPLCGGGCATTFQGWSPNGSHLIYGGSVADTTGKSVSSIPPGDASWSTFDEILVGSDTAIFEVRPDGSDYLKLQDGTFHMPVWAPNATTFAFTKGAGLWVANAPTPTPPPPAVDQGVRVVKQFMQARLDGQVEHAKSFLDDTGQAAYAGTSPALIPQGTPGFKRFYVLISEADPSNNSVRAVVRLVFGQNKTEQFSIDETLTLVRAQPTDPYLIDGAVAGPQVALGKGPQVVAVKITSTEVDVTFDSDLVPTSISNVTLQDAQGVQVTGSANYSDRTVSFTNLQLTPGAHYRLVVLPGVQDVGNHNVVGEYDLDLVGPAPEPVAGGVTPSPSPSPAAAVTPTPSPTS